MINNKKYSSIALRNKARSVTTPILGTWLNEVTLSIRNPKFSKLKNYAKIDYNMKGFIVYEQIVCIN